MKFLVAQVCMVILSSSAAFAQTGPNDLVDPNKIAEATSPIFTHYRDALAAEAARPQPSTLKDRLLKLGRVDQAGRDALSEVKFNGFSPAEVRAARYVMSNEFRAHDQVDLAELLTLMPPSGWFKLSEVGEEAARAAFFIVQHSDDVEVQKNALSRMKPLLGTAELNGQLYGLLYDRIELGGGRAQLYGTQTACVDGKYVPKRLLDPAHVDDRRRAAGFKESEAQYLKRFEGEPCH